MKKILLSLTLALVSSLTASATDFYLWLNAASGDETSWAVSGLQKITFSGTNVVITTTDGSSSTYAMSDVSKLHFETSPTAINDVQAGQAVRFDGTALQVSASEGTRVDVFTATGTLAGRATVDGTGRVSLSNLPSGVYMVKIGNNTTKILKR